MTMREPPLRYSSIAPQSLIAGAGAARRCQRPAWLPSPSSTAARCLHAVAALPTLSAGKVDTVAMQSYLLVILLCPPAIPYARPLVRDDNGLPQPDRCSRRSLPTTMAIHTNRL